VFKARRTHASISDDDDDKRRVNDIERASSRGSASERVM